MDALEVGDFLNEFWMVDEWIAISLNFIDCFVPLLFEGVGRVLAMPLSQEGLFCWIDFNVISNREVKERASDVTLMGIGWLKVIL